jgi:hypothetical protein
VPAAAESISIIDQPDPPATSAHAALSVVDCGDMTRGFLTWSTIQRRA